jgi:hypothetical protein
MLNPQALYQQNKQHACYHHHQQVWQLLLKDQEFHKSPELDKYWLVIWTWSLNTKYRKKSLWGFIFSELLDLLSLSSPPLIYTHHLFILTISTQPNYTNHLTNILDRQLTISLCLFYYCHSCYKSEKGKLWATELGSWQGPGKRQTQCGSIVNGFN